MAIPDFQTLMLPVLRAAQSGEVAIGAVIDALASEFGLTEEERATLLPSGRQATFANRVHWARFHLIKAGFLKPTRRAHVTLTDRGRKLLDGGPAKVDLRVLAQSPEYQQFRAGAAGNGAAEPEPTPLTETRTPDEIMRQAYADTTDALASDLLARIKAASPAFFERLTVQLLVAMGYGGSVADAGRALGGSGDGGVDGVIDEDALGLDRIYVQAKRYGERPVGPEAINSFNGALDQKKAGKGLFVTTSTFTKAAEDAAAKASRRIVLVDGVKFARLMIQHDVGCRRVEEMIVRKVDEEFFDG